MEIQSGINSALAGIQGGMQKAAQATQNITSATAVQSVGAAEPLASLTNELVALNQSKLQVEASAKALSANNEALGSVIDINV